MGKRDKRISHRFPIMTVLTVIRETAGDCIADRSLAPLGSLVLGTLDEATGPAAPIAWALAAPVGDFWQALCQARGFAEYINVRNGGRVVNEWQTFGALITLRPWHHRDPLNAPWRQVSHWISYNMQ